MKSPFALVLGVLLFTHCGFAHEKVRAQSAHQTLKADKTSDPDASEASSDADEASESSEADDADDAEASDDSNYADASGVSDLSEFIDAQVSFLSDRLLRGMTLTSHQPSVFGSLSSDIETPSILPNLFLGASGSNVRFPESPSSVEVDGEAALSYNLTFDLAVRAGAQYYWYYADKNRNSWEFPVGIEYGGFLLEAAYSPHWDDLGAHAWYVSLGYEADLPLGFSVGAYSGYSFLPPGPELKSYADFRVTLGYEILGLNFEVSGIFTRLQKIQINEEIIDPEEPELRETKSTEKIFGGSRAVFSVTKYF